MTTGGIGPNGQWIEGEPQAAARAPLSAYELAVANGFIGTLSQWLASLQGAPGATGAASTVPGPTGPAGETRLKWAKVRLTTNASGVWSENLGAGLFAAEPGLAVVPKMASGSYDWSTTITGSAVAGYTATVMFTKRKNSIDISLGALLNVGLIEASPGVVNFDLEAFERTA